MNRESLEHLIRAAAAVTNEDELVIIGSQSILGSVPNAPEELLFSREADIYPLRNPEAADLIDGAIGEDSTFDEHFGYYAQGVGPETAKLPSGWEGRLIKIQNANTDHKIGLCLSPSDLAASKLAAFREKDLKFVDALLSHGLVSAAELAVRIDTLQTDESIKSRARAWLQRRVGQLSRKDRSTSPSRP